VLAGDPAPAQRAVKVDLVRRHAAMGRDECCHASRVLLLTVGARQAVPYLGPALVRDCVGLSARLAAAAIRADKQARGYFDLETTRSGRHSAEGE
jgi:hypothetical protein